jgi:pyruvate formate lyase activating enzyme
MNIGGFLPLSLSDYPGRVAAVVFTQGCNFRCPFCHNGDLIPRVRSAGKSLSEEDVLRRLEARRRQLDGVVVSGGEPTLQDDLLQFVQALKRLGYLVKLDTNGSRPGVLAALLREAIVDYVAMDVKAPLDGYSRLAGVEVQPGVIQASIELLAGSGIEHEFRTTVVGPLLDDEDMGAIRTLIPAGSTYRLQPFRPEHARADWLRGDSGISPANTVASQQRFPHVLAIGDADEH